MLDHPKFDGTQWKAKACDTPITDITHLRGRLVFESGNGITAAKGALGMSLQTPRAVTEEDVALLDGAVGGAPGDGDADDADEADDEPAGLPPPPPPIVPAGDDRRAMLLADVLNDPTNVEPRKVYADELSTQNDARGEFIQLDIALDGPLSIRKRAQLRARRDELLAAQRKAWFPYTGRLRLGRGFAEAVSAGWQQLQPKLFETEPVIEVGVSLGEDEVDQLLAAGWLPRIRRLAIRGQIGDDGFASLARARSTRLSRVAERDGERDQRRRARRAPRRSAQPAHARAVGQPDRRRGPRGARRLEASARGRDALPLAVRAVGVGCRDPARRSRAGEADQADAVEQQDLGDEIAGVLTKHAAKLPALRHLELKGADLGATGLKTLARAKLPALHRIDVRRNGLVDGPAKTDPRIRI